MTERSQNKLTLVIGLMVAVLISFGLAVATLSTGKDFTMKAEERESIEAVIEDYLVTKPEILLRAIDSFGKKQISQALSKYRKEIETPFPGAEAGNPNGDIIIVEFFDYRCSYCKAQYHEMKKLIETDPGVRLIYRDLPVLDRRGRQPLSRRAAEAGLAAGLQGKYMEMHNAIFSSEGRLTQKKLVRIIRSVGLDEKKISKDVDDVLPYLRRNLQIANALQFSGTPVIVIGDQIYEGLHRAEVLRRIIARKRAKRKKSVEP